ncbi:MAG TPA: hypothetical protein VKS78_02425 [Roseiarcus sp.]|nr:hypothetical protein [Roseiarcus sp.]
MTIGRTLTMLALLAGLPTPSAQAAPSNQFLAHLLGHLYPDGETFACFSRRYDDTYLAAHPGQNVVFAKALVSAHFRASSLDRKYDFYSYELGLAFRFRGRPETLTSSASCGDGRPKDSLRDGAVCAGPAGAPDAANGTARMRVAVAGDHSMVMTIPNGSDLWAPGPIEQRHDVVKNPFGLDDKVFRLDRTDVSQCEDLAFDRQKPLRAHEP